MREKYYTPWPAPTRLSGGTVKKWKCPKCKAKVKTLGSATAFHWCKAQAGKYLPLEEQDAEQ